MADVNTLTNLQKTYAGPHASPASLNTPFREALRSYSTSQSLQFSEDTLGNIYITRRERDTDIAPIAIAFPLDGGLSEPSFTSAFRVFSLLSEVSLPCNPVLVGWTTLGSRLIGQELWEASATAPSYSVPPELQEFQGKTNAKDVSFSAVFGASEQKGIPLRIEGSSILVEKTRKLATGQTDIRQSHKKIIRAPWVSITGPEAEAVAVAAIKEYSAYIVALFDNFD
ncbi:hypothetical protein F5Y00DRAFT_238239 [Daldinia vernicosa]|uniref:uncharacterized protein n=1 Tax=Daldinia vernicosa TaxID=114800 RepID=UPI00200841B5|nr:uncharacterized protein F5Y00DRAFT_238239 [Daldinia vernicosa]KAI0848376.1 hypothetical protein F5Y00DRAFT_238239 [Daldinia vernicosa]